MTDREVLNKRIEMYRLTDKQIDIVEMVSQGLSNAEIATKLGRSESTVKAHLTSAYTSMALKGRAQLIVWCLKSDRGLV